MKKNNISGNIASLTDLFAKNQKVILLKLTDTIDLEKQLEVNATWIISEFNSNIYNNYYNYIKTKGNNSKI